MEVLEAVEELNIKILATLEWNAVAGELKSKWLERRHPLTNTIITAGGNAFNQQDIVMQDTLGTERIKVKFKSDTKLMVKLMVKLTDAGVIFNYPGTDTQQVDGHRGRDERD